MTKRHRKSNRKPSQYTFFRDMKSILYSENKITKSFKEFTRLQILPLIKLDGYKLDQKEKIVFHCIQNLALAELRHKVIADNRNGSNTLRVAVWDAIIEAGLCKVCKGKQSVNMISRYRASTKLVKLLKTYQERTYIPFDLAFNTQRKQPTKDAHIYLHSGSRDLETGKILPKDQQKRILPLTDYPPGIQRNLIEKEHKLYECNLINSNHEWIVKYPEDKRLQLEYEPNYKLKQSHSGELNRFSRLVGWTPIAIQQLSKKERKQIAIDGEKATELDFGEFDIRRHYHFRGLNPTGDTYRPELILPNWYDSPAATIKKKRIVRKFIKKSTNILLNVSSKSQAYRAVGNLLHKQPKKRKRFLWNIFINHEDIFSAAPTQITERILQAHSDIKPVFCSNQGEMMMSLGAEIMFEIRWNFALKDKPCYCIHDSILCRRSDRSFAKRMMKKVYRKWTGNRFNPKINIEF